MQQQKLNLLNKPRDKCGWLLLAYFSVNFYNNVYPNPVSLSNIFKKKNSFILALILYKNINLTVLVMFDKNDKKKKL